MELLLVSLSSLLVSLVTELIKKFKLNSWQVRGLVVIISLVFGAVYYIFITYLPMTLQMNIQDFVAGTMAGAVFYYEFFSKHLIVKDNG